MQKPISLIGILLFVISAFINPISAQSSNPIISNISDNRNSFTNSQIPNYEKFEITFNVQTSATNLQMPFDPSPPPGVAAGIGVSVDGLFTPDNWVTTYIQPAFYYQEYQDQVKSGREWFYPTGNFFWKVRFAPNLEGNWQFKLRAQDANGIIETQPQPFTVTTSTNKGFIRVSKTDSRYFEYDDGTYFPALGYNMNYDHINWNNPVLSNQNNFQKMGQNGIQLIRMWLSQWSIFDSPWNSWQSINPSLHGAYIPYSGITFAESYQASDVSMKIDTAVNPCMFLGFVQASPAVKRNTSYKIEIRYKTSGITGPKIAGLPFGFMAKTGGWLWDSADVTKRCDYPGTGTPVTPYQSTDTASWTTLTSVLNSGNADYLPNFFLTMENTTAGSSFVDYVSIQEDLGGGNLGPNIVSKPWMAHHQYFDQRNSYAFDKVVDLARQNGVYLRPVILEKNGPIFNRIDYNGNYTPTSSNNNFYGNWRTVTKVRWLQQAWWRYLQARWGYSPNIHSWELLNEGDPYSGLHYTVADELGKYMHQFKPNDHLVSTSNWHSFPVPGFWANNNYPNIDFTDVHRYIAKDQPVSVRVDIPTSGSGITTNDATAFYDSAYATEGISINLGAKQPYGANKPVIRGETGFTDSGSETPSSLLQADTQGIWLHNFVWGGINSGGLIESYWNETAHIYTTGFDQRSHFKKYYDFISTIHLSNGNYQDVQAASPDSNIRILGQKDLTNNKAHIWVQNKNHTWKNVVDGVTITPINTTVTIPGFPANTQFQADLYNTYTGLVDSSQNITTDQNGNLVIPITDLSTDTAIKLTNNSITPTSVPIAGDANGDGTANVTDFIIWKTEFLNPTSSPTADFNNDGSINLSDFMAWKNAFVNGL